MSLELRRDDLPRYRTTLRVRSINKCENVKSDLVQDILYTMTGLEKSAANFITDEDIIKDSRPWDCHG
jgi:hypothetical protein